MPRFAGDEPCRTNPDCFYSEDGETHLKAKHAIAKTLCASCPMLLACRTWAIHSERYGYWGGMSPGERSMYRQVHGIGLAEPHLRSRRGGEFDAGETEADVPRTKGYG